MVVVFILMCVFCKWTRKNKIGNDDHIRSEDGIQDDKQSNYGHVNNNSFEIEKNHDIDDQAVTESNHLENRT